MMANNVIAGNTADTTAGGVESSDGEVVFTGNAVVGNVAGNYPALAVTADDVYENNTIAGNHATNSDATSAIWVSGLYGFFKHPRFTANNIFGNSPTYFLRNDNPHSTDSAEPYLNVEANWWGTTAEADLINGIYDFGEDLNKGYVDYTPWSTQIFTDVPVAPPCGLTFASGVNPDEILLNWSDNAEVDLAGYRVTIKKSFH